MWFPWRMLIQENILAVSFEIYFLWCFLMFEIFALCFFCVCCTAMPWVCCSMFLFGYLNVVMQLQLVCIYVCMYVCMYAKKWETAVNVFKVVKLTRSVRCMICDTHLFCNSLYDWAQLYNHPTDLVCLSQKPKIQSRTCVRNINCSGAKALNCMWNQTLPLVHGSMRSSKRFFWAKT